MYSNIKKYLIIFIVIILVVSCIKKYRYELGGEYIVDYDGNGKFHLLDKDNTILVKSHVVAFNFDSVFIIVEQKPVSVILKETWDDPKMNLEKRDKLLEKSSLRCYWVINKTISCDYVGFDSINQIAKYSNVLGPYSKNEFIIKRNELGIPQELKFKQE